MEFCDECGGLMFPTTIKGKKVFKCRCGAIKDFSEEISESYTVKKKVERSYRDEVVNVKDILKWKEKNLRSAIKDFKCPRCGYDKAQLETRQTRSADEGMTHFIICLKCGKMIKIGS